MQRLVSRSEARSKERRKSRWIPSKNCRTLAPTSPKACGSATGIHRLALSRAKRGRHSLQALAFRQCIIPFSTPSVRTYTQSLLTKPLSYLQTHVSVQPYTNYVSPQRFHQPGSFVPERWLPHPSCLAEWASDQLSAMLPFSLGPRRRIGQILAMFEMWLILARLVWVFDTEAVQGSILDWTTLNCFSTIQKQPVRVRLKARVR